MLRVSKVETIFMAKPAPGRRKGTPKTGGRKSGTSNKSTAERRLIAERELAASSGTALAPIHEAELELATAKAKGKVYTLGKERLAEIDELMWGEAQGWIELARKGNVAAVPTA